MKVLSKRKNNGGLRKNRIQAKVWKKESGLVSIEENDQDSSEGQMNEQEIDISMVSRISESEEVKEPEKTPRLRERQKIESDPLGILEDDSRNKRDLSLLAGI